MKLENQVCSLELAKQLKELGVKQESFFTWSTHTMPATLWAAGRIEELDYKVLDYNRFAAFTVAELGEMLPKETFVRVRHLLKKKAWLYSVFEPDGATWDIWYKTNTMDDDLEYLPLCSDTNEANARAKMLIYLLENKLITL